MRLLQLMIILFIVLGLSCEVNVGPSVALEYEEANPDFFPLGLYAVPSDAFDQVEAGGFNMVQIYHWNQSLAEAQAYLEAAEAAGLRVRQNMPRDYLYAGDAFWIEWVTTLSAYDALAWWNLPEEPIIRGTDYAIMARLYEIVRQYDPQQRPAVLYFGTTQGLEDWCDVEDIIAVGCYPEYMGQPRACMKYWIDRARQACPSKVVIGVPPFFDSNEFGVPGGYPTPHEARFDAYTALITGAKGLNWFYYLGGVSLTELWEGLQEIVSELNALGPVMLSPDVPQTVTVSVISGPAQSPEVYGQYVYDSIQILQKGEGGAYIFASNLATDTVVAEFSGLSADVRAVVVLYERRIIPVSGGSFRDSFAEADVHIYVALTRVIYLPAILKDAHTARRPTCD
jgi:hypothetical protein